MTFDISRRGFLGSAAGLSLGLWLGAGAQSQTGTPPPGGRLLHHIDCTQELGAEAYFGHGDVKIVDSPTGRYREAEGKPLSRFGYRFAIENVGRPHVAVVRYPDDKRRYMCIQDGTGYDLTTGVFTGWEQPLSNTLIELRQIFWPRWNDCSIVFMTWSEGEPAAAASIDIFELPDLPALEVPGDPGDGSRRELGIQYEDPCGCCGAEGARTREEWIDHLVAYAKHSGQGLLVYPMAWYHGPQFPSEREPADGFGVVLAADRRQYSRWTTHPVDWYAPMLERFSREGLAFQGALTLLRLGSLMEKMNIDLAAIQAGADTYNNMLWNNEVQSSTNDWTPFYNARNFDVVAERLKGAPPAEPASLVQGWAYGERGANSHTGPMFNPLHPTVQAAIIGFAEEIGRRYGPYPAFRGISFNMFASAMPWYGSIHAGYDDYSVALFEKETGIGVPVDPKAPDRFQKRYEWLLFTCRPAWVAWRCKKIRQLFGEIRKALAAARPDLRVVITLWDETTVTNVMGYAGAALALHARSSAIEFYRDAGIDVDLYRDEPGLEIDRGMGNSRDRGGHGSYSSGGTTTPIDQNTMYRDFDYLDQPALDAFHAHNLPGAFLFNCWVEAWGQHVWFEPEANDPNVAEFSIMDGQSVEGLVRINSNYPKDGFWWDSQLRITPAFPAAPHFLEPYAHAMAELDACRITRGGLFLDKAHTEELRRFAVAYRALPRAKFEAVPGATDPAVARWLARDGRVYFYVVNRMHCTLDCALQFDAPRTLQNLAARESVDAPAEWKFTLAPYELKSFSAPAEAKILRFTAAAPGDIAARLSQEAQSALAAMEAAPSRGVNVPGREEMLGRLQQALAEGRFAYVRRALTSYIVRRCLA